MLRHNAIRHTCLLEITVQIDELVRINCHSIIHRTLEVIGLQHIQDGQFLFTQCVLSRQINHHLVDHACRMTAQRFRSGY